MAAVPRGTEDSQVSLASRNRKRELRFVICGSVDDGKSTLLGRLLRDSGTVLRDRSPAAGTERSMRGAPGDGLDFVSPVGGLQANGEQGGLIDVACRVFESDRRKFMAFDVPGHERHTRTLVTAASHADLAILLVDARKGILTRTRRHSQIVSLMGIRQVILAVNKMDLVGYRQDAFSSIADDYGPFARELGIEQVHAVPLSALTGANVFARPDRPPWYDGPTLMELLEAVEIEPAGTDRPPEVADQFAAHLIWMDAQPMLPERSYLASFASASALARVTDLVHRVDVDTLGRFAAKTLERNEVGYCKISLDRPVPFDSHGDIRRTGAFVLVDRSTKATVGAGMIGFALRRAGNVVWQELKTDKAERARAIGQKPCVLWLTGLSGAGKSTIADQLEQKLRALGRHTYVLDGDNVRHGLNRDLGFTDRDRVENIRRVSEVAKLMVDAGLIVIVSFISPFRSEREMARNLMERGEFFEIFVDTPLDVCEARDPKGLYRKARRGEIPNFTGIDSPYEAPKAPDLRIDTTRLSAEQAAERVVHLLRSAQDSVRETDDP